MAQNYRATKSGFAKDVQEKLAAQFDKGEAAKTLRWITLLHASVPSHIQAAVDKIPKNIQECQMDEYHGYLYDGLVLGFLMAVLDSKLTESLNGKAWTVSDKAIFETNRQRERIGLFLGFCTKYGLKSAFEFQTDQLFEQTNLNQVIVCLSQLGIEAQTKPGYSGPKEYWMAKHQQNKREFTEQQLRSGETIIGLQMGTNKVANASGVSFGAQRHITDSY